MFLELPEWSNTHCSQFRYVETGRGDAGFYQTGGRNIWISLKAIFYYFTGCFSTGAL
jgi:hypothetical protein